MPTKERLEHLNDVADGDGKGWRRRGDFKSDSEWKAGVNAKPDTATTRRTYADQKAASQAAITQRGTAVARGAYVVQPPASSPPAPPSSPPPSSPPPPAIASSLAVASTAPATPASVSAQETTPTPVTPIVPDWHEGSGHDDDGEPGASGNH